MKGKGHIPLGGLPAWQRPFSGCCRTMANTSRKAQRAGAAGNPCSSNRKKKNLVPEPPCGHVEAGQATQPPAAPALRAREQGMWGALTQGRPPLAPRLRREAQSVALSSSHPPANPKDTVKTETRRASAGLRQGLTQNRRGTPSVPHPHAQPLTALAPACNRAHRSVHGEDASLPTLCDEGWLAWTVRARFPEKGQWARPG